jgi:hypothetical protein
MPTRTLKLLQAAQEALEKVSDTYRNPHMLEADLDILGSALRKLPPKLTRLPKEATQVFGLCDILYHYSKLGLLTSDAVESCEALRELAEESDYDVTDEEKFEEKVAEEIATLKDALGKMLTKLEDEADSQNN